ncbi:eukaryotic mitochondrial regulator protein-domain-containing protein [Coniella lustricola]|uniref:Eukaryotic mitochondrial regulator protein-domain-containing protein n=1 Tax=Coniella lustricola TaxID=2025994 RepID=A0A2T3AEI5_9PEZI|nr:eukaryotic mitochondrial regulator protein-domain-containing protein [Coniella lustricola]
MDEKGWLQLVGDQKADPRQPFPNNPFFKAPLVLDEAAREMIWKRVFMDEEPIKVVSAELGIDIRRVAAVVRMKTVEKEWVNEGKKLATPYRKAIMSMLFLHKYRKGQPPQPLEPHNEIHVHSYTMQQLFVPTSESRQFTREDAAEAFHHTMLSADERIPHKEYVEYIKRIDKGMSGEKSKKLFVEESKASQAADEARDRQVGENANKLTTAVPTPRFEFRFKKMRADDVGKDGRSRKGVGWRYGAPYEDRKKDQIKIPTQIV